jgi:predicted dehydrogenase
LITAAIVGLGRWGQTLVAAVQGKSDRLRFSTAVSRDPARVRDFTTQHGLGVVGSLDAVLADPAIDAVVLATPHSQHVGEVIAAAAAKKAVFCEKPLALSRSEAARGVEACRAAGIVLGIGTDKRFFPALSEVARVVDSGELGPLLHVEAHFSNEVAAGFAAWRDSFEETPAGGMTGTGIHMLDALVRVAGPIRRIHAQMLSQKPSPDPHDSVAVLLDFASGVGGTLAAVRSTPAFLRLHAFGRNGSIEAVSRTDVILRKSGAAPETRRLPNVDSVRVNLEAFADAVAGRAAYPISQATILNVTTAFIAIAEAIKAGGGMREV